MKELTKIKCQAFLEVLGITIGLVVFLMAAEEGVKLAQRTFGYDVVGLSIVILCLVLMLSILMSLAFKLRVDQLAREKEATLKTAKQMDDDDEFSEECLREIDRFEQRRKERIKSVDKLLDWRMKNIDVI